MTKNTINITICLTVLILALSTSCKKILEQEPKNSTYAEQFWKSANDCEYAIAGNYGLLRDAFTNYNFRYYMYGDAVAKAYFTINYNGDGLEGIQDGNFTFQYNLENLGDWTKFYKTIAMSNLILKKLPGISDEVLEKTVTGGTEYRNKIMGEALFIRALTYFQMVKVWGDVPLVTESYDDPMTAPQLARSPKADVMAQIEKDCLAAADMLKWGYESKLDIAVRANRGSVMALLAHLYLWRATTTDLTTSAPIMADVNKADACIDSITTYGGYTLVDTAAYGKQFIGRSSESIFEIYMSDDAKEGSNTHIGLEFLTKDYVNGYGTGHRYWVPVSYLSAHYYWKPKFNWATDGESDSVDHRFVSNFDLLQSGNPTCRKYSNISYRNPGTQTNPYMSNNMIIFRLSDMKLLKAEIALYKDDLTSAIDIINFFRQRNGGNSYFFVDDTYSKDDLFYEYALERGKELYLEGHIYWDLIRTRQYGNFIPWLSDSRFVQGGFYWPVNPILFRDNRNLVQTKYWRGKV